MRHPTGNGYKNRRCHPCPSFEFKMAIPQLILLALFASNAAANPPQDLSDKIDRILESGEDLALYDDAYGPLPEEATKIPPTEKMTTEKTTTEKTTTTEKMPTTKIAGYQEPKRKQEEVKIVIESRDLGLSTEVVASLSAGGSFLLAVLLALLRFCARQPRVRELVIELLDRVFQRMLDVRGFWARRMPQPLPIAQGVIPLPAP